MRIALATCRHPGEHDHDFDFLAPALRRRGAEVEAAIWDDERIEWQNFDLVLINSTWDYHTKLDEFRAWLRATNKRAPLRNAPKLVNWNLDKRYLRELQDGGVPTIPTVWTEAGHEAAALSAVAERGWADVIVKPVVDLGASKLARVEPEMLERILLSLGEPGMAQPFLPSLQSEGELSIVFIGGEPAHSLRKVPAQGDFRVQPQYGGRHRAVPMPAEALRIGRAALEIATRASGAEPLYARVDLVRDLSGELALIELELIEPALYMDIAPASAELLAKQLLASAPPVRRR